MANICTTNYTIAGEESQLKELKSLFKELYFQENGLMKSGYLSIGDLFNKLYGEKLDADWYGELTFADISCEGEITFDVDTKWIRHDEIENALQEFFPDIDIYWASEEFGCGIFETNDRNGDFFYKEMYYVSTWEDSEYCEGEKDLVRWLNDYYKKEVCTDLASALAFVEEHEGDEEYDCPYIYKRKIV